MSSEVSYQMKLKQDCTADMTRTYAGKTMNVKLAVPAVLAVTASTAGTANFTIVGKHYNVSLFTARGSDTSPQNIFSII